MNSWTIEPIYLAFDIDISFEPMKVFVIFLFFLSLESLLVLFLDLVMKKYKNACLFIQYEKKDVHYPSFIKFKFYNKYDKNIIMITTLGVQ